MTGVHKVLVAARELIKTPERWTRGWYAYDGRGNKVSAEDPAASCFCAMGAIRRAAGMRGEKPANDALVKVIKQWSPYDTIHQFNDSVSHDRVLAAFDTAIAISNHQSGDAEPQKVVVP